MDPFGRLLDGLVHEVEAARVGHRRLAHPLAATGAPVFVLDAGQITPAEPLITLLGPDKATSEDPITFTVQRHGLPAGGTLSGDAGRGWAIAANGDAVTFTPDPALRSGRHVLSVRAGDMSAARTIQIDNAITVEAQVNPQGDVVLTASNPFPRVRRLTIKSVAPGRDLKAIELDLPPAGTAEARITLDLSHAGGMTTIPVTLAASLPSGESGYVTFGQRGETVIAGVTPWQTITPVIDGDLDEWSAMPACVLDQAHQAKPVGRFAKPNWRGPSDLSARFWAGSDASNLYLAVQIRDDHHVQHMADDQMWRGDSVQFATQVEGVRYEFTVGISDDGRVRIRQDSPSKRMLEGASAAARRVEGGWALELAIPWQQAGMSGVATLPNFSLLINDNDGPHNDGGNNRRGFIEWFSGIGGERKDPAQYGPVQPAGPLTQAEVR